MAGSGINDGLCPAAPVVEGKALTEISGNLETHEEITEPRDEGLSTPISASNLSNSSGVEPSTASPVLNLLGAKVNLLIKRATLRKLSRVQAILPLR